MSFQHQDLGVKKPNAFKAFNHLITNVHLANYLRNQNLEKVSNSKLGITHLLIIQMII